MMVLSHSLLLSRPEAPTSVNCGKWSTAHLLFALSDSRFQGNAGSLYSSGLIIMFSLSRRFFLFLSNLSSMTPTSFNRTAATSLFFFSAGGSSIPISDLQLAPSEMSKSWASYQQSLSYQFLTSVHQLLLYGQESTLVYSISSVSTFTPLSSDWKTYGHAASYVRTENSPDSSSILMEDPIGG